MKKKLIIIGAGISGLTAGIYAQKSGFDTVIYEKHNIPGGNCTGWRRQGYFIEGGMHWLTGADSSMPVHFFWREVGAIDDTTVFKKHDPFMVWDDGKTQTKIYRNMSHLQKHFLELSPQDKKQIRYLCRDIKKLNSIHKIPVRDLQGVKINGAKSYPFLKLLKIIPFYPRMKALKRMSGEEYASHFRHDGIRNIIQQAVGPEFGALPMLLTLGTIISGDGLYPEGGSLKMTENMAKKFISSGGKIIYSTPVEKVLIEGGKVKGVIANSEKLTAEAVIISTDTLSAIQKFLNIPIEERWINNLRSKAQIKLSCFVSLGIRKDLSKWPHHYIFPLEKPFNIGNIIYNHLNANNYASYKGYAPKGCSVVTFILHGDNYDYWKQVKEDGTYDEKKNEVAQKVIECLAQKLDLELKDIEIYDVATPLTFERYCGTYHGSWMYTWTKNNSIFEFYPSKLKSVKGLYFAGQRMQPPGGLPPALYTGRRAVQYLCRDENVVFNGKPSY